MYRNTPRDPRRRFKCQWTHCRWTNSRPYNVCSDYQANQIGTKIIQRTCTRILPRLLKHISSVFGPNPEGHITHLIMHILIITLITNRHVCDHRLERILNFSCKFSVHRRIPRARCERHWIHFSGSYKRIHYIYIYILITRSITNRWVFLSYISPLSPFPGFKLIGYSEWSI